jgi:hypothetical protein
MGGPVLPEKEGEQGIIHTTERKSQGKGVRTQGSLPRSRSLQDGLLFLACERAAKTVHVWLQNHHQEWHGILCIMPNKMKQKASICMSCMSALAACSHQQSM